MAALFTGIDHPAIGCFDIEKQIGWYCGTLGMKVLGNDGKTPASVLLGFGEGATTAGSMLELMPVRAAGAKPADVDRFAPGLRHVALKVSDFDEAYAVLKAAGATFIGEPVNAVAGGRLISLRDPEGNELQIVQR